MTARLRCGRLPVISNSGFTTHSPVSSSGSDPTNEYQCTRAHGSVAAVRLTLSRLTKLWPFQLVADLPITGRSQTEVSTQSQLRVSHSHNINTWCMSTLAPTQANLLLLRQAFAAALTSPGPMPRPLCCSTTNHRIPKVKYQGTCVKTCVLSLVGTLV
jgi:hypothetical protein